MAVRLYERQLFPESVHFNNLVLSVLSNSELRAFEAALDKLTRNAEDIAEAKPVAAKADRRHGRGAHVARALVRLDALDGDDLAVPTAVFLYDGVELGRRTGSA